MNEYQSEKKHTTKTQSWQTRKRKPEATPATSSLRVEKSRNHQSSEKRETEQQKPAIDERMKRNNQSPEKQQTEREKCVIQ